MPRPGSKCQGGPKPAGKPHPGLELPEGYVKPKPAGKKKSRRKKRNNDVSQQEPKCDIDRARSILLKSSQQHGSASEDKMHKKKETEFDKWKKNGKISPESINYIEFMEGPVRFSENGEPICKMEPSIGFDKKRYDQAREKKYEYEPLIPSREDVYLPKKRDVNNQNTHWVIPGLPCSYADEFPDGHVPAKNQEEAMKVMKYYPHIRLNTQVSGLEI